MLWLLLVLLIVLLIWYSLELWSGSRGDCDIILQVEVQQDKQAEIKEHEAGFIFVTSLYNQGKQQGLFIDCMARVLPDGNPRPGVEILTEVLNADNPRTDGYWDACIIKAGKVLPIAILIRIKSSQPIAGLLQDLSEIWLEICYKSYCRKPLRYQRCAFKVKLQDFPAVKSLSLPQPPAPKAKFAPEGVIPLKTRLLRPGDDVIAIIKHYTKNLAVPGDVIAVAESPLAIMQNRLRYVEDIKPGWLAGRLNRYIHHDSSLSSIYGMEMAIREAGAPRILLAFILGVLGKILGRKGDFYAWAGRAAATIDDCTGTMPPFDKYVVLGPANAAQVVQDIKTQTGLEAAVVDVNDLRRVDILASTCPQLHDALRKALESNPQGNAAENTPLVLITQSALTQAAQDSAPQTQA